MKWNEILKARQEKKMTQVEVSREIGVGLSTYRYWESGGGQPNPVNLQKLKNVLGVK